MWRPTLGGILLALSLATPSLAASTKDHDNCESESDQLIVSGCTAIIEDASEPADSRATAYRNRAIAYDGTDDDKALTDYSEAIRLHPQVGGALKNRADIYFRRKDYDRALADFSEAIRLSPNDADAYIRRGGVFRGKQPPDNARAIADYTAALRFTPRDFRIYRARASAYMVRKDFDRAIVDYNSVVSLNPEEPWVRFFARIERASAYLKKRDFKNAIADYDEALKIHPEQASLFHTRGNVYRSLGNYDLAVADYGRAIEVMDDSDRDGYTIYLDRCELRLNANRDLPLALEDCNKALEVSPGDDSIYRIMRDMNEGNTSGTDFATLPLETDILKTRARVEYRLGAFDKAIDDYSTMLRRWPEDWKAFCARGLVKLKTGDVSGGKADLASADVAWKKMPASAAKWKCTPRVLN